MPNYAGYEWSQGRAVHRWVWEQSHGPIPKGGIIHHIDGDKSNNALDNLMLVMSKRDHARVHRGWELRDDGWYRPRRKREGGSGLVKHDETETARNRAQVVSTVPQQDLASVLSVAKQPYSTMLLVQWAVGLRPGEVCKMRLADLRMDTGLITTPPDGKTGSRELYLDVDGLCARSLREWIAMRPEGPYLFGGTEPVLVNTYRVTVARYCERCGVPRFRPYALRHTYATELIHEHHAISDVSQALGHTSVLTTARYYLHPDPEMIRKLNNGR